MKSFSRFVDSLFENSFDFKGTMLKDFNQTLTRLYLQGTYLHRKPHEEVVQSLIFSGQWSLPISRRPGFESSHRQLLLNIFNCYLFVKKTKIKMPEMAHLKKYQLHWLVDEQNVLLFWVMAVFTVFSSSRKIPGANRINKLQSLLLNNVH